MANGRAELLGGKEMLAAIRSKLNGAADRLENKALKTAGEPIAEAMSARVNVSNLKYKHLKQDIKVSRVIRQDGLKFVRIGAGKKTAWRGHFLEWGTSKMSAQPWAEPGFLEKKGEALQILVDEFRKGLRGK
ncbi:phage protein, HK97 gp10 family [Paenibacillus sp. UNCCL117]|uniref:HK97-gp10 family putative phage morphogenesis protein n=1 Tax=unclassified Paenibacillus TaxID=185978 RepID=UPI0008893C6C|nr:MULTISPECIES: HK97-gp10 family putative phage morphogenesis protein [unclassified Paenibacillus]SDD27042.1 phage protein, HK97 gp10 family [Paenibacillus sp. cl123]SFW40616.1 phage protein, HK97 gp10 family [Paenibacillus sp. UNCCL117]